MPNQLPANRTGCLVAAVILGALIAGLYINESRECTGCINGAFIHD
jgi:hypothetical protein